MDPLTLFLLAGSVTTTTAALLSVFPLALEEINLTVLLLVACIVLLLKISRTASSLKALYVDQQPAPAPEKSAFDCTAEQQAKYLALAEQNVAEFLSFSAPDSKTPWKPLGQVEGADAFSAPVPDSPVLLIKGRTYGVRRSLDDITFAMTRTRTSEELSLHLRSVDKQFLEGEVISTIHEVPGKTEGVPIQRTQLHRCAFAAPPLPPRDFTYLMHTRQTQIDGKPAVVCVCKSIDIPSCPERWATHGYVRGKIGISGYAFRSTGAGTWDVSYLVNADPGGSLPKWIVNLVSKDQAGNAGRVKTAMNYCNLAEKALGVVCGEYQGMLTRTAPSEALPLGPFEVGKPILVRAWAAGEAASRVTCTIEDSSGGQLKVGAVRAEAEGGQLMRFSATAKSAGKHSLRWSCEPASRFERMMGGPKVVVCYVGR